LKNLVIERAILSSNCKKLSLGQCSCKEARDVNIKVKMTFPIAIEPGRQDCWEIGSLKTLDITKFQVGKEARKYVLTH